MDVNENIKDQAVIINALAVEKLRNEQNKLREKGIRMSLSAIASKAIMENIQGE